MPSPFPGMDPFIEGQVWEDFHPTFITAMREALTVQLRPRYVVRVEVRVYLEYTMDEPPPQMRPDVAVLDALGRYGPPGSQGGVAVMSAIEPLVMTLPMPEERREAFLLITKRHDAEVVTAIELLSPTNKRSGSDGRREYLTKRETVLRSAAHLVELDLLRGGERLPTIEPLPAADYYAFVCRRQERPRVRVYPWTLRHRLPTIPIPLADDDPDVPLDLQAVFSTVYDRAGYDYGLDYRRAVAPPLAEAELGWAQAVLQPPAPPEA